MKKYSFKDFFLSVLLMCMMCTCVIAQNDSKPVTELKKLYAENTDFKSVVDGMFKNVHELPNGSPNPWKGKNVEDLYTFMNDWFYFLPNTKNGLDKILEFSFLYHNNTDGMRFILEEPGRSWSLRFIEERGKYMDSPESAQKVSEWLADTGLNHSDFVDPVGGFKSFNDFFTRDLRPGARPIAAMEDNSVLVAPADGVVNMINNDIQMETPIPTKAGMTLSLTELLGGSKYCEKFVGGTAMAFFLLPTNYHHFHAPVSGTMVESNQDVGDRLFGMPDILDIINEGNIAYNKDYSVFQNFRHGYYIINTHEYGYVAMIPIGLQTIGSVRFEEKFKNIQSSNPTEVYKGDKLGHFAYGGSTVLLLFEKNRLNAIKVQMGQKVGVLSD